MELKCDNCGNQYDKTFKVLLKGQEYTFDSFECAIHALAPRCLHCETPVVGHGVEAHGKIFCCAHCAKENRETGIVDRAS